MAMQANNGVQLSASFIPGPIGNIIDMEAVIACPEML
jgi:hypothetical protein